jgi:hypothetical protein
MGISKNFVVKNGFEASTDLILADADTRKVGVGTTSPQYTLDVAGGIGATDFYLTGIGTFVDELNVGLDGTVLTVLGAGNSIGIGTALPAYLLDIRSPVSTGQTALYIQGDVEITGDIRADDFFIDDAEIQDLTVTDTFLVVGLSTFNSNVFINAALDVSGITTLGNYVDINNSVDISNDLNVVGVTTLATADINAGEIDVTRIETGDLSVTGITTLATISVVGAALSSLTVSGIATIFTGIVTDLSGTNLNYIGIGTITTLNSTNASLTNITSTGISTLGVTSTTNLTSQDLNITGVSTLGTVRISSGIITSTSGIVTYYGDGSNLTGLAGNPSLQNVLDTGNTSTIGMSIVGVITATSFVGDGSGLSGISGAGSTVFNDTTTDQEFFPLFTDITTGTITASGISTSKLTYNPFTGTLTVIDLNSTSDINLKENIKTVENALETVNSLRGVSFDWKETGKSSYGIIAQELEEVLPSLVSNGEIKTVNYNGLIGVLIEAIKDLKAEIEELKNS